MGRRDAMVSRIRISDIKPWRCDSPPIAQRYAAMLRAGYKLPPIILIDLGGVYEIFNGKHRTRAAKMLGRKTIEAKVGVNADQPIKRGTRTKRVSIVAPKRV